MGDDPGAWARVFEAAEEAEPKTPLTWLAGKLDYSLQRVQNWSVRGIPAREYPAIAQVFGESLEWVAGLAPRKAKEKESEGLAFRDLNAFETQLVTFFRQLDADHQHEVLTALNDMIPKGGAPSKADPFNHRKVRGRSRFGELEQAPQADKKVRK